MNVGKKIKEEEKKKVEDYYIKLFIEIQGKPQQEKAFQEFNEITAELTKKFEDEQNKEWRELYKTLKINWISKRKDLEAKFTKDENKQNFANGLTTHLTHLTSYGVWETRMKKWKKWCEEYDSGRSTLTDEEKQTAKTYLAELYSISTRAAQKKFKWRNASEILNEEVNPEILTTFLKK